VGAFGTLCALFCLKRVFAARKRIPQRLNFRLLWVGLVRGGFDGWLRGLGKFLSTFYPFSSVYLFPASARLCRISVLLKQQSAQRLATDRDFVLSLNTKNNF
jgi:hypothetical protein